MPTIAARATRTQTWLEGLGEWSWPGQGAAAAAAEALPPPWVPTFPPSGFAAPDVPTASASGASAYAQHGRARRLLIGLLLSALAGVCLALAVQGRLGIERVLGLQSAPQTGARVSAARTPMLQPLPKLARVSADAAGSTIAKAVYPSVALHGKGSFYVYLPPGYASRSMAAAAAARSVRYPVLYLLHGNSQSATAFLRIGVRERLDRLISAHKIPPLIAVMIQGGPGSNNWRNIRGAHYESYVLEAQELIDRTLPTIARRDSRAIAGLSMGGYGAMALTVNNPDRFGVVESWLGFFNGLGDQLRLDRGEISRLGLHAFIYGAASDSIADPSENAPFAARLRAAGAQAQSAVYRGEHDLDTIEAHLTHMLTFAGRSLRHN